MRRQAPELPSITSRWIFGTLLLHGLSITFLYGAFDWHLKRGYTSFEVLLLSFCVLIYLKVVFADIRYVINGGEKDSGGETE